MDKSRIFSVPAKVSSPFLRVKIPDLDLIKTDGKKGGTKEDVRCVVTNIFHENNDKNLIYVGYTFNGSENFIIIKEVPFFLSRVVFLLEDSRT